jgi:ATP-dependent Lon protease
MTLASLFSGKPVRSDVGITGEITLRGRVLPVGGIKMKALAAHRAGLKTVILPKRNESDIEELPDEVRDAMSFITVDSIDEAIAEAFTNPPAGGMVVNGCEPEVNLEIGDPGDVEAVPLTC